MRMYLGVYCISTYVAGGVSTGVSFITIRQKIFYTGEDEILEKLPTSLSVTRFGFC